MARIFNFGDIRNIFGPGQKINRISIIFYSEKKGTEVDIRVIKKGREYLVSVHSPSNYRPFANSYKRKKEAMEDVLKIARDFGLKEKENKKINKEKLNLDLEDENLNIRGRKLKEGEFIENTDYGFYIGHFNDKGEIEKEAYDKKGNLLFNGEYVSFPDDETYKDILAEGLGKGFILKTKSGKKMAFDVWGNKLFQGTIFKDLRKNNEKNIIELILEDGSTKAFELNKKTPAFLGRLF